MSERSGRVKFDNDGTMRVKGDANDTSRTGGTDIDTRGLRYSRPGGQTRRVRTEQEEWECPGENCGNTNERWRVQCERCGWNRRTGRPAP